MSNATTTTVTGTLTFQSEKDGREVTRSFPPFQADTGWAWVDLVDHAHDLLYDTLPDLRGEPGTDDFAQWPPERDIHGHPTYGWIHLDEEIIETDS
jgi:hypothetical protein